MPFWHLFHQGLHGKLCFIIKQRSPIFLALETGFMEDIFPQTGVVSIEGWFGDDFHKEHTTYTPRVRSSQESSHSYENLMPWPI